MRARAVSHSSGAGFDRAPAIVIRPARADDLGPIGDLEQASFSDPWSRQSFRNLLGDDRVLFVVAESAPGEVVGYLVTWFVADEAEVANVVVATPARRRGIGGALIDRALAEARSRGAATVYLEVRESNAAARRLYERRGFVVVGRRKRYYHRPDEDALVLRCTVAPSGAT
jgi:ribosomal-protein-alanine N-acetyltransferase